MCVMELLDGNVSACRLGETIKTVLKLAKKKASDIPSNATVLNYDVEILILALRQLGEDLSRDENISLLTDETSKFGEKDMRYHVAASDGNMMVIGLSEIETKSAKDTLSTYKEICNEASMKILVHTVATMSDRAATEVKVNELLQQHRKEVLPMVVKEYDSMMSAEEKGPLKF